MHAASLQASPARSPEPSNGPSDCSGRRIDPLRWTAREQQQGRFCCLATCAAAAVRERHKRPREACGASGTLTKLPLLSSGVGANERFISAKMQPTRSAGPWSPFHSDRRALRAYRRTTPRDARAWPISLNQRAHLLRASLHHALRRNYASKSAPRRDPRAGASRARSDDR